MCIAANGRTGDGRRIPEPDALVIPALEWASPSSKPSLTRTAQEEIGL